MPFLVQRVVAILTPAGQPVGCRTEVIGGEWETLTGAKIEADRQATAELARGDQGDAIVVVEAGAAHWNPVYQGLVG